LGVVYTLLSYFGVLMIIGGILGGIAGFEAGQSGADGAEAGRIAGAKFGQEWGWLVLLVSIAFNSIAVSRGWLPWTKNRKPA
jgi:hypothetical protein